MKADLLIINASQVVTCAGPPPKRADAMRDPVIIPDGAIAIQDGVIAAVGSSAEIRHHFDSAQVLDAANRAICPGFTDAHTHVVYAGTRIDEFERRLRGESYLDILAKGGGINSTVRHVRAASVDQLVAESRPRLKEMLRLGTTSAEVKTGYGLSTSDELKLLEAIERLNTSDSVDVIPTFLGAHAIPPEFSGRPDEYVEGIVHEQIPAAIAWYRTSSFGSRRIPFFIDVFCERNAFSLHQSRRVLDTGIAHGMRAKAHVDEFSNLGGAAMAISLHASSIDHLDVTTPEEIRQAAASDTVCVSMPAVNFHFGSERFADVRSMIDAGAAVALATDINPGSAPCPSLPLVMAIACRYQKLAPAEALQAVTINAAFATGIAAHAGSLEAGKVADLLILKSPDYRSLMYEFGGNPIHTVVKRGTVRVNG